MGKPKGQMRLLAEDWFARNQSHLTQDSFVVQTGNGRIRSRSCQDYYDFVRFNLKDDNGNLLFPEENKTFLVRIVKITQKIRGQHGAIVRANPKITHRNVGDPNSTDSNEQKKYLDFYLDNNPEKKQQYQQTKLIAQQRFRERLKENRKAELGVYKLGAAFEGKLAVNVAELIMKRPLAELQNMSPLEYAEKVGGVYTWFTAQQSEVEIQNEAIRFLTDGQKINRKRGHKDYRHNAVLMWNNQRQPFTDNICPYEERFNWGFEAITKPDCVALGIQHLILVDEKISEKDARQIEKACHYILHHLPLGKRLHRVAGAGTGKPSEVVDGKSRVVGITFLPPNFYENNPNIVIVGSKNSTSEQASVQTEQEASALLTEQTSSISTSTVSTSITAIPTEQTLEPS